MDDGTDRKFGSKGELFQKDNSIKTNVNSTHPLNFHSSLLKKIVKIKK